MYKKDLDKCYQNGILSKSEYEEWFANMRETDSGELIGMCPYGKAYYKYELNGDIFDQPLWKFVLNSINPPLGIETDFPVFSKYGYTYTGICDGFNWNKEKLQNAPEIDLWQIIAISSRYWEVNYERWYHNKIKDGK